MSTCYKTMAKSLKVTSDNVRWAWVLKMQRLLLMNKGQIWFGQWRQCLWIDVSFCWIYFKQGSSKLIGWHNTKTECHTTFVIVRSCIFRLSSNEALFLYSWMQIDWINKLIENIDPQYIKPNSSIHILKNILDCFGLTS